MTTRTNLATLCKVDPLFKDSPIPLTAHMWATWHRYDMRDRFHLNSDRDRLSFIVWYLLEYVPGRPFDLPRIDDSLIQVLNKPVSAFGPMTTFLHEVWRTRFRHDEQFNIYTEIGYLRFSSLVIYELASSVLVRPLVPQALVAALNAPDTYDGRHYSSKGARAHHDRVDIYRSRYNWADWREREAFNLDLIVHSFVRDGNDLGVAPEVIAYWAAPAARAERRVSRFMLILAMMTERFAFNDPAEALRQADAIVNWFAKDVLPRFPRMKILAPDVETADVESIEQDQIRQRLKTQYGVDYLPGDKDEEIDILLIGPFSAASGLGTGTRRSVNALQTLGCRLRVMNFMFDNPSAPLESVPKELHYRGERPKLTLWHYNAEFLSEAIATIPMFINKERNVGYFFWETEAMPVNHQLGCDMVDEIWAPSEFVKDCYSEKGVPVVNVGTSVDLPVLKRHFSRSDLGLERDEFIVMFSFDSYSVIHRKNPAAVVRAFLKAFPEGSEKARLIIKTQNFSNNHWNAINGRGEELMELVDSDPRVSLVNRTMTLDELYSLKKEVDCYISLHRSEGFGYGPAEAMALGKPVIMTNYSANAEFAGVDACYLVDAHQVPVLQREYLYWRPEMTWAEVDVDQAAAFIRHVYENPEQAKKVGENAKTHIAENFGRKALAENYRRRLVELGMM